MSKRKAAILSSLRDSESNNIENNNTSQTTFSSSSLSIITSRNFLTNRTNNTNNTLANESDEDYNEEGQTLAMKEKRSRRITSQFNDLSQLREFSLTPSTQNMDESQLASNAPSSASASQLALKKTTNKDPENQMRAGTIVKLKMKNFKCHSFLEFNLHKYINFILGRNGSGKSAVMDAIILCLGGKAASTGRQASAKTFIKTNCDKAELSLEIVNEGDECYEQERYGKRIKIERKISKDGASSYRLLSEHGKMVSNKKGELENIMEQFNIQVENPVCFLNQETSKHFLNSSNPVDKYTLFMKASQLEAMKKLQEEIDREKETAITMVREKEGHLPKLQSEVHTWEVKYKNCQSVDKLRAKQNMLYQEYAWAKVIECEKEVEVAKRDRAKLTKMREKLAEKMEDAKTALKQTETEFNEAKANIDKISKQSNNWILRERTVLVAEKEATANYKQVVQEIKKLNSLIEKKSEQKAELTVKLEEERKNTQIDYEEEKKNKEAKVNELKKKIKEAMDMERYKSDEIQRYKTASEENNKRLTETKFSIDDHDKRVKNLEKDVSNLANSKNDQLLKFGEFMPALVNDVVRQSEAGRFRDKPRGPIGFYVQPKESKWALAIEQCLGAIVNSFVCSNYDDEKLMHQLIAKHVQEVRRRPRVIVTDFKTPLYDCSRFRPEETRYSTVYEMVTISETVVANVLMDQRKIESILLLPNRDVGRQVIEFNSTQKCYEAYLLTGDQLIGKPSFRSYACPFKDAKYFIENPENMIRKKKEEIASLTESLNKYKAQFNKLEEENKESLKMKKSLEKDVDVLRRGKMSLDNKLRDVEGIKIPEPVDLMVFEDEINALQNAIDQATKNINEINERTSQLKETFLQAKEDRAKYENEYKTYEESINEIQKVYEEIKEKRSSSEQAVAHYNNILVKQQQPKEAEADSKVQDMEKSLAMVMKAADGIGKRIESKSTVKKIETEIAAVEKQIMQSQKEHGNEEEITRKYNEVLTKYRQIQTDIKRMKKFLICLEEALAKRKDRTLSYTKSKALMCAQNFTKYLCSRNFIGSLVFDHDNCKLNIAVHPNRSKETKEANVDLKSLSGGERSYSTVAFLLSLWSIVECPILFLDEFDVFMDQINRNFAMDLIVDAACNSLSSQYVFLTPQEMGNIKPNKLIMMFKMSDPKRSIDQDANQENQSLE